MRVAYRLWHDGRHKEKYRKEKEDVVVLATEINGEPVIIRRRDVREYVEDPVFLYALQVYQYVKLWGMPNGGGWAEEDAFILEAITAIEIENNKIEAEQYESISSGGNSSNIEERLRRQ